MPLAVCHYPRLRGMKCRDSAGIASIAFHYTVSSRTSHLSPIDARRTTCCEAHRVAQYLTPLDQESREGGTYVDVPEIIVGRRPYRIVGRRR
jgi:hypothetical protein